MPRFLRTIADRWEKNTQPVNRYEGFKGDGAVVLRDRRGTAKAEIPSVSEKANGGTLSDDPLAIYKPSTAKSVDAAKAMANFTGWTYAAVHAIAREVSGIQFRLYRLNGTEDTEIEDHLLLDLLDGVNEHMTGIELRYVTAAHLELTGNAYWLLDGANTDIAQPLALHPLNPGKMRVKL